MIVEKLVARIGIDKVAHFFGSAFLCLALGRFIHWGLAVLVTLAVGFAKELLDPKFNWWDILADTLGVAVGTVLLLL